MFLSKCVFLHNQIVHFVINSRCKCILTYTVSYLYSYLCLTGHLKSVAVMQHLNCYAVDGNRGDCGT